MYSADRCFSWNLYQGENIIVKEPQPEAMSTVANGNNAVSDLHKLKNEQAENSVSIGKNLSEKEVTSDTVPPNSKKRKLVKKHKASNPINYTIWLAGHAATLIFGVLSQFFLLSNKWYINSISYRLAFVGAIVSMAMTTKHKFGLKFLPSPSTLVASENFQYVVLACLWMFTFKSIFKLFPYVILSLLHISESKKITAITSQAKFLASLIAYDELILIVYLFLRTLCFRNTSGYQLTIFLVFYWLRVLYNKETTTLFSTLVDKADYKFKDIKNPKFQKIWSRIKESIRRRQQDGL